MSDAPFAAASSAAEPSSKQAIRSASSPQAGGSRSNILRQTLICAAGGLAAGLAVTAMLLADPADRPQTATLESIAPAELGEAALSLDPNAGRQGLDDARQCKVPLAYLTLTAASGDPAGRVRIRSGGYLSPNITITSAPRRVAIPFPAPYQSGRGMVSIEGAARDLKLWLSPGRAFPMLNGVEAINVVWTPKNAC